MSPNGMTDELVVVSSSCVVMLVRCSKPEARAPGQVVVWHSEACLIPVVPLVAQVLEEPPVRVLFAVLSPLNLGVAVVMVLAV